MTHSRARGAGRTVATDLVQIAPAPHAWRTAVRAGVTMLTVLSVLHLAGALDHAAYATFGAFCVVYAGPRPVRGRWRLQLGLASLLCSAVVCGAAVAVSPQRSWLAIPMAAAWAAIGAVASDRWRWVPPGPMFLVFAAATCASIPTTAAAIPSAGLTALATAAFGIMLGLLEERIAPVDGEPPLSPSHPLPRRRVHAIRCAVAVLLAGSAATAAGIERPYWAMVSSVVPLAGATIRHQVVRGTHRLWGSGAGLAVAAVLLFLHLPVTAVLVTVALLQALAELTIARNYGLALLFITPLALLVTQLGAAEPTRDLLLARLAETVIGVTVGVGIALLTRARPANPEG